MKDDNKIANALYKLQQLIQQMLNNPRDAHRFAAEAKQLISDANLDTALAAYIDFICFQVSPQGTVQKAYESTKVPSEEELKFLKDSVQLWNNLKAFENTYNLGSLLDIIERNPHSEEARKAINQTLEICKDQNKFKERQIQLHEELRELKILFESIEKQYENLKASNKSDPQNEGMFAALESMIIHFKEKVQAAEKIAEKEAKAYLHYVEAKFEVGQGAPEEIIKAKFKEKISENIGKEHPEAKSLVGALNNAIDSQSMEEGFDKFMSAYQNRLVANKEKQEALSNGNTKNNNELRYSIENSNANSQNKGMDQQNTYASETKMRTTSLKTYGPFTKKIKEEREGLENPNNKGPTK